MNIKNLNHGQKKFKIAKLTLASSLILGAILTTSTITHANTSSQPISSFSSNQNSVDKTELQALYNKFKDITQGNNNLSVWHTFQTALTNAKVILDDSNASFVQVFNATVNLKNASDSLAPSVDKTELQALYNKFKDTTQGNNNLSVWHTFQAALTNAKVILDDSNASFVQVFNATVNLKNASDSLI